MQSTEDIQQEDYRTYVEGLTTALISSLDSGEFLLENLEHHANSLIKYPLVKIPLGNHSTAEEALDTLVSYQATINLEYTKDKRDFMDSNENAVTEVEAMIFSIRDKIYEYLEAKNKKFSDLESEELFEIILEFKKRTIKEKIASQILSGEHISDKEVLRQENLYAIALPNFVQAYRIRSKLSEYEFHPDMDILM